MECRRSPCARSLIAWPLALAFAAAACGHGGRAAGPGSDGGAGATSSSGGAGATSQGGGGDSAPADASSAGATGTAGQGGLDAPTVADASEETAARGDGGAATAPAGVGCSGAGTLCWDFEEGTLPAGWKPYRNEFNGTLLVDNTRPHRGMYALHAKDFQGGNEANQGGPKKTMQFQLPAGFGPVLWGRAFIYTTPARAASHAGFFNARYPRPNSTATAIDTLDWYEAATYMGTYMSIWHPPEPPGYPEDVQVTTTQIVLDDWACLEWLFDGQNGDAPEAADPRMWLDGVELAWPDTFIYPTGSARPKHEKAQNFTVLEAGIYLYQGLTTVTNWWIDDLAVGPARIGCD